MAERNSNLAYDLSRYEARDERARQRKNITPKAAKKPSETPAAILAVILIAAAGALLSLCISSKADIAAVHAAIVNEEAQVLELEQENTRMKTELEQKSSQKAVENYAENVLGMQKLNKAQIEYISLESGNIAEISSSNDNIFKKIKQAMDNFVEYLKG